MKTEHEFNAYLKKQFKRHTAYKAVKIADRFKVGLPDWLIFHDGRSVAVECKFAKKKKEGNLLSHVVSPPQIATMESFLRVGVPTFVLLGIDETKAMYAGTTLTPAGNITGGMLAEYFTEYPFGSEHLLLEMLFTCKK